MKEKILKKLYEEKERAENKKETFGSDYTNTEDSLATGYIEGVKEAIKIVKQIK